MGAYRAKRYVVTLLSVSLLVVLGGLGAFAVLDSTTGSRTLQSSILAQPAQAKPPKDVVVINCVTTTPVTGAIVTDAFSSSANAPSVTLSAGCAQALADLLDAGFKLVDDSGGTFYTLERR